jgi:hypothetical protein
VAEAVIRAALMAMALVAPALVSAVLVAPALAPAACFLIPRTFLTPTSFSSYSHLFPLYFKFG